MKTESILSIFSFTSIVRYGLVLILIGIGLLKFTRHEAEAIRPLAENSPFFFWAFEFLSTRMFSALTGVIEITVGILIAFRPVSPTLSVLGSIGAIFTFFIILTFTVSSPMYLNKGLTIPLVPYSAWKFLIVHIILLAASVWTAYEAFTAERVS